MLEKLNLNFMNINRRLNTFELELFIELINNHIQWDIILDIMKLKNDEQEIIKRIDPKYIDLNIHCLNVIPKVNRVDWKLKIRLRQKFIDEYVNKSFLYPVFLWLLSLNILTFMLIYLLPNLIYSFNTISKVSDHLSFFIKIAQFMIGFEWGVIILLMYLVLNLKSKQIINLYQYFYIKFPNNIWIYYISYMYLSDFHYLLNLNISIDEIMNILKYNNSIYKQISENVIKCLKNGNSIKNSFSLIDQTFFSLIKIEDFERKFGERLENYLKVLNKQLELNIKKYSSYFMTLVYIQIGLMVFLVYSVLLYPLKLIEGMNL